MLGVCKTTFAQIRCAPDHAAELISQLVFGEYVVVADYREDWCLIETEHQYRGWTRSGQVSLLQVDEIKDSPPLQIFTGNSQIVEFSGQTIGLQKGVFDRQMPLQFQAMSGWMDIAQPKPVSVFQLIADAKNTLGTPYVWGGKTPSGFDCSGLIQFLFQLQGYSFPRDAWQQAELGEAVDFNLEKPDFEPGTLLFFQRPQKKIHHVAVSLGGEVYIHASEWIRINSFDPSSEMYVADRHQTLVLAKTLRSENLISLHKAFAQLADFAF